MKRSIILLNSCLIFTVLHAQIDHVNTLAPILANADPRNLEAPPPPPGTITFTNHVLPVSSICVVDMNGDHLDDVVSVGNQMVTIAEQQPNGTFIVDPVPTPVAMYMPSWSIAAGDIDGNGYNDLLYGGGSGATFMLRSDDGDSFIQQGFSQYIFSQRTNMVDINNDGHLDAFVCHDVDANVHFLNDGNGNLTFHQGGLGMTGGNYGSLWTDHDNDGDLDLFVAKCGSDPVDMLMRNNGDGTFTDVAPANGMADFHEAWSSAWGDFDNDGDMDVMIGTSGGSFHKLLRNDLGSFTNVSASSGINTVSNYSIEWITHDLDNDGWLDILGAQTIYINNGDMTFTAQTHTPSVPIPDNGPVGDLNNDGFLDIMNGNVAKINDGNDNHWLKVHTVGTASNSNGIGARITITSALGTQIREVRSGDGFRYMSSLNTHFGLGGDTEIYELVVKWPSGVINTIKNVEVDQTIVVVEELGTGLATRSTPELRVHPNPTDRMVMVEGDILPNSTITIHDAMGRIVLRSPFQGAPIDVSDLATGTYSLQALSATGVMHVRLVIE